MRLKKTCQQVQKQGIPVRMGTLCALMERHTVMATAGTMMLRRALP
jgi:hypothetical protein